MTDDATPTEKAQQHEEGTTDDRPAVLTRPFALLLVAAVGVTAALATALFLIFGALGLSGAPYWSVGIAVIGGIVMRRRLLDDPGVAQVLLFSGGTIGGALAGLWLGGLLLPLL
jgi:MFS family permease